MQVDLGGKYRIRAYLDSSHRVLPDYMLISIPIRALLSKGHDAPPQDAEAGPKLLSQESFSLLLRFWPGRTSSFVIVVAEEEKIGQAR